MHPQTESATPRQSKSPIFLGNYGDVDGGRGYLGSFSVCFEGDRLKKVINSLGQEKCTPDKILATPMPSMGDTLLKVKKNATEFYKGY